MPSSRCSIVESVIRVPFLCKQTTICEVGLAASMWKTVLGGCQFCDVASQMCSFHSFVWWHNASSSVGTIDTAVANHNKLTLCMPLSQHVVFMSEMVLKLVSCTAEVFANKGLILVDSCGLQLSSTCTKMRLF